jgi:hypothetical protein
MDFRKAVFCRRRGLAAVPSIGWAKTVRECEAEWKANKAAIQAAPKPGAPVASPEPSRVPASRADQIRRVHDGGGSQGKMPV